MTRDSAVVSTQMWLWGYGYYVDSYDLDVWESLENYNPKMVIIEINSSIPPGILQKHGFKTKGNSFSSALVKEKNNG